MEAQSSFAAALLAPCTTIGRRNAVSTTEACRAIAHTSPHGKDTYSGNTLQIHRLSLEDQCRQLIPAQEMYTRMAFGREAASLGCPVTILAMPLGNRCRQSGALMDTSGEDSLVRDYLTGPVGLGGTGYGMKQEGPCGAPPLHKCP